MTESILTKTKTKTAIGTAVVFLILGILAAGASRTQNPKVCDSNSGSKAGQRCVKNSDCIGPGSFNAKCAVRPVTPPPQLPDLVLGGASMSCNGTGALTYEFLLPGVINQGTGPAGESVTRIWVRRVTPGPVPVFDKLFFNDHNTNALVAGEAMTVSGIIPTEFMTANHVLGIEGKTDATNAVTESNENNNPWGPYYVACPRSRPIFFLHPASPQGAGIPGLGEVLRFNISASPDGDVKVGRLTFRIDTTDNSENDWNQWQDSGETGGLSTADFSLYDTADPATPLTAVMRLWGADGQDPLDGVSDGDGDGDPDTHEVVFYARFDFLNPLVIPANTAKSFQFKVDTTGASVAGNDNITATIVLLNGSVGPILNQDYASFDANPANDTFMGSGVIYGEGDSGTIPLIRADEPSPQAQIRISVGMAGAGAPLDGLPVVGNTISF